MNPKEIRECLREARFTGSLGVEEVEEIIKVLDEAWQERDRLIGEISVMQADSDYWRALAKERQEWLRGALSELADEAGA